MNELIEYKSKVYFVRGKSVMLDKDLAAFYGVETSGFNKARKRKDEHFGDTVFQLKKEEWMEILSIQGIKFNGGNLPWAYTEKAAYKMAFVLESKTSLKVADLILEVFVSVRSGQLVPAQSDNKVLQLEMRIEKLEKDMMGQVRPSNYFHAPVTLIQGDHNQVQIGSHEDVVMNLARLLTDKQVSEHKGLTALLAKSIEQASRKDKKGLLESLSAITDIGVKLSSLSTSIPTLIAWVGKYL